MTWIRIKVGKKLLMLNPSQVVTLEDRGEFNIFFDLADGRVGQWYPEQRTTQTYAALLKALDYKGTA